MIIFWFERHFLTNVLGTPGSAISLALCTLLCPVRHANQYPSQKMQHSSCFIAFKWNNTACGSSKVSLLVGNETAAARTKWCRLHRKGYDEVKRLKLRSHITLFTQTHTISNSHHFKQHNKINLISGASWGCFCAPPSCIWLWNNRRFCPRAGRAGLSSRSRCSSSWRARGCRRCW